MHPAKVHRDHLHNLTDLPNIGRAMAEDLRLLGVHRPEQLKGLDPLEMYERLQTITGKRQDPCMLDVFLSVTRFINGEAPRSWWEYTQERKRMLESIR
ncbi:MAG: mitomycin resistance protein [Desulfovibrionales bacterium]|nr:MAG: mitomycin resistance protein [Desulfovibrionales bacterium]